VTRVLRPLPPTFATTRDALHMLAEHVLAAARYRSTKRIGLRATPGGFGTPPFGNGERILVDGDELVHEHDGLAPHARITTVRAAANFVGIEPGLPPGIYEAATPLRPDEPLDVDVAAARALGEWYALGDAALRQMRERAAQSSPSEIQLWPEHFDLACDFGDADAGTRAYYGASPGDTTVTEPYLYVGPWDNARRIGRFQQYPFGAAVRYSELATAADPAAGALRFFGDSAAMLLD
jgi:hypothetical protein